MIDKVWVYNKAFVQEFSFPTVSEQIASFRIEKELFKIKNSVVVKLEVLDNHWCFSESKDYKILKDKKVFFQRKANPGDILKLYTAEDEEFFLIVDKGKREIPVFRKYILNKKSKEITMGRAENNDIVLTVSPLISKHHAVLEYTKTGWTIKDEGRNGLYINGKKVKERQILKYGDEIDIFGCHMVYLKEIIAVMNEADEVIVRNKDLTPADKESIKWMSMLPVLVQDEEIESQFMPSPRFIAEYDTEEFEIDAPPAPKGQQERSMFMAIGPSLSMAIPMLIGVAITGMGIMAIGLATMVGSAVIGAFWAYMNVKKQKAEDIRAEEERVQKYSEYLMQKEKMLKNQYDFNRNEMIKMYPSASECASYRKSSSRLWNRNARQDDFLFIRLGVGTAPMPKNIRIPEEHFTLIQDPMAEKPARIKALYENLMDVPLGVDLLKHQLIGVVGGKNLEGVYSLFRIIAVQVAANLNYKDVKLVLLCDSNQIKDRRLLEDLKWMPHIWDDERTFRFAGNSEESISEISEKIVPILRNRKEQEEKIQTQRTEYKTHYVFLVTSMKIIEDSLIAEYLLEQNASLGITSFIGAQEVSQLPNACEYIIQKDTAFSGEYSVNEAENNWKKIMYDFISSAEVNTFAHRLASIRLKTVETQKGIPDKFTFMEMYNIASTEELEIRERWKRAKSYENLRVPIGMREGNKLCFLDIHEHAHGPHGLVAGTPGAGKSETLQSWILSLAVNFSPEDVAFFLVDFKGGGMANQFQALPHLAGAITNLTENQIYRALVSIKSENRRRQRMFAQTGHADVDIYKYTKMYKNKEVSEPLPHLLIIVDEFAELKKEYPEFIAELISVSRIGRSLGVHLVLATQTPAGTVDDNIDKNTRFRICLRVADEQGSNDMLKRPDAAYIKQTGRAYLRVGFDEVFEQFQSAWSGAEYRLDSAESLQEVAGLCTVNGRTEILGNYQKMQQKEKKEQQWVKKLFQITGEILDKEKMSAKMYLANQEYRDYLNGKFYARFRKEDFNILKSPYNDERLLDLLTVYNATEESKREWTEAEIIQMAHSMKRFFPENSTKTQLIAVIEAICRTMKETGIVIENHLWIPEIPEYLYLSELIKDTNYLTDQRNDERGWNLKACVGKYDDPARQFQANAIVDFGNQGNYGIYGSIGSGKSVFLQTVMYSLITNYTPKEINIYCFDFSSRMLESFKEAPHIGGILHEGNTEATEKFFFMMREIFKERKKQLGGGNFRQYQQDGKKGIPAIVIVIDQYGVFREKTDGKYDSQMLEIAKEGNGIGVYLIVSAGGVGNDEVPMKLKDSLKNSVCLQMNDKYSYKELMHAEKMDIYPKTGVKGRGLWNRQGEALEFQTALCLVEHNDYERGRQIKKLCLEMADQWKGERARTIPMIPEQPVYSEFSKLPEVKRILKDDRHLPLGYDVKSAAVWSLDLSRMYCYLVSGRKGTGKKNFLRMAIRMASNKGGELYVFGKERGILEKTAKEVNAVYYSEQDDLTEFCLGFKPELIRRNKKKNEMADAGFVDDELYEKMNDEKKIFIFIEDLPTFAETLYHPEEGKPALNGFFETFTDKGWYHQIFIFAGINQDDKSIAAGRGVFENIVRDRNGIHFGGNTAAQQILNFDYITSFREQSQVEKPGIGQLSSGSGNMSAEKVIIPLAGK